MRVVHRNGIGVDCRPDNLTLIPVSTGSQPDPHYEPHDVNIEAGIYWQALQHVVVNPLYELSVGFLKFLLYLSLICLSILQLQHLLYSA